MLHRLSLTALLGLATLGASAQTFNAAKMDSLLNSLAANHKLMGSLALTHAGQVVYSHAFGSARVAPPVPATPATRYRIGSISKIFTAVLIFQLIEEKKLTLETPLATFFPQLPNAKSITIDQLLSHRSGLHNFTEDATFTQYMVQPHSPAEMVALIGQAKPNFEPGAKFSYSNSNYVLLGYIVEKLARMPYAQALQKRITGKLNLRDTYYGGKSAAQSQEALSYGPDGAGGWQLAPETDMSVPAGAGALISTPLDLDRFLAALFEGRLVAASSLATMQTLRDGYGRGLIALPFGAKKGFGHNGGIDAFNSLAGYYAEDKLAVALCTNGGAYPLNEVLVAALTVYYGQPYHLPNLAPSTYVPTPADLTRYAGTYGSPQFPLKITMTPEGTTLRSQATGQGSFLLEPVGPGSFRFEQAGITLTFDPAKPTFTFTQGGHSLLMTKE